MQHRIGATAYVPAMDVGRRLRQLDAKLGAAPAEGETWGGYYARVSRWRGLNRVPFLALLSELTQRLDALEARVAELERDAAQEGRPAG